MSVVYVCGVCVWCMCGVYVWWVCSVCVVCMCGGVVAALAIDDLSCKDVVLLLFYFIVLYCIVFFVCVLYFNKIVVLIGGWGLGRNH